MGKKEREMLQGRIVGALSCMIRGDCELEEEFCRSGRARALIDDGLGVGRGDNTPNIVTKRCLFFLRALLGSDGSSRERIQHFERCVTKVIDLALIDDNDDVDTR